MKNIFLSYAGVVFASGQGDGDRDDMPYLFLFFSAIIHILVLWALTNSGGSFLKRFIAPVEPVHEIEIVDARDIRIVNLPEDVRGKLKVPDKITAFAQRSQEVEQEEYAKSSKGAAASVASPATLPSAIMLVNPGGGERVEEKVEKKSSKKVALDKDTDEDIIIEEESKGATSLMPEILRPKLSAKDKLGEGAGTDKGSVSLFPTKGTLEQIARNESKAVDSPKEGGGMTLLLNTSEFKYQKYFMNIKKRIEFYWEYPPLAARKGQQGRLNIDFVINRDGTIETNGIDIIKSSNYPILDDAATTALRLASPFNPFPEGFDIETITVHGSFEYSLTRRKR